MSLHSFISLTLGTPCICYHGSEDFSPIQGHWISKNYLFCPGIWQIKFAHLTLLSCGNIILPAPFMEYRRVIALNGDCVPMPISESQIKRTSEWTSLPKALVPLSMSHGQEPSHWACGHWSFPRHKEQTYRFSVRDPSKRILWVWEEGCENCRYRQQPEMKTTLPVRHPMGPLDVRILDLCGV